MKQPLIGITCNVMRPDRDRPIYRGMELQFAERTLVETVSRAGGLPVLLPIPPLTKSVSCISSRIDGLILASGLDVNADAYGSAPAKGNWAESPRRDNFEIALARLFSQQRRPLLGICRGLQIINVAQGGTLCGEVPTEEIAHRDALIYDNNRHEVEVVKGTTLGEIVGTGRLEVVSVHHQAVEQLGGHLRVSARSADGVIEAIEATAPGFLVGVQWHPEWSRDTASAALFGRFVAESAGAAAALDSNEIEGRRS